MGHPTDFDCAIGFDHPPVYLKAFGSVLMVTLLVVSAVSVAALGLAKLSAMGGYSKFVLHPSHWLIGV